MVILLQGIEFALIINVISEKLSGMQLCQVVRGGQQQKTIAKKALLEGNIYVEKMGYSCFNAHRRYRHIRQKLTFGEETP